MKLNKSKNNKGKIHPSPSSSSSTIDPLSNLSTILPATIITLISVLSLSDKEVLAYMISHSLNYYSPTSSAVKTTKKVTAAVTNSKGKKFTAVVDHTVPTFDCGCFDCYTTYWYRWDSSPNREFIHQVLEAFEEHLAAVEQQQPPTSAAKKVTPTKSTRRKEKGKKNGACSSSSSTENAAAVVIDAVVEEEASQEEVECAAAEDGGGGGEEAVVVAVEQKKKVLPDVIGLINSRLWNLWGPNV